MVPTVKAFGDAFQAYQKQWPNDGYILHQQRFMETFQFLRQYYTGGRIVDVGGWPGDFSCTLASLQFDVLLVDKDPLRPTMKVFDPDTGIWGLSPEGSLAAKCRTYGVETVQCDIEREPLPVPDGSLDFIVFTEIIEHLRIGLLPALRELRRVLKPEGNLLITTPNLLSLRNRLSFLLGKASYDTLEMPYDALDAEERIGHSGHFRVFSMPELHDLLHRTGFRVRACHYWQFTEPSSIASWSLYSLRMKMYDQLVRWITPLGNQLYLLATPA